MKRRKILALVLAASMALSLNYAPADAAKKAGVKKVTLKSSISGNSKQIVIAKGKSVKLVSNVVVAKGTKKSAKKSAKKVTYKVANKKIAAVSGKGIVKAKKVGKTKVTAISKADKKKKATIGVKVVAGAVNSIKISKKSLNINAGQKVALKATVKAKKGACKDVAWSSSNTKVATVNKKGHVTGVSAGTANITAKAVDGSNKKATCKVSVNSSASVAQVNLTGISVLNSRSIAFSLSSAYPLDMSKVVVKSKKYQSGIFNNVVKISSLSSTDNVNYTIVIDNRNVIYEGDFVSIEIPSLTGTVKMLQTQYREAVCAFTDETISTWEVGKYKRESFKFEYSKGYSSYAINALPAGLSAETRDGRLYIKGTPVAAGAVDAVVSGTDEFGNTHSETIHFIVGAENAIVGASVQEYILIGTEASYRSMSTYFVGGSGEYNYSVVADANNIVKNKNEDSSLDSSDIYAKVLVPGTFYVTVRATDASNPGLYADINCVFNVKQGISIGGVIKDAQGNPMNSGTITFTNKNRNSKYCDHAYYYVQSSTSTYSAIVEPGIYDISASYSYGSDGAEDYNLSTQYLYSQALTTTRTGYDIQLSNIYKVVITCADPEFSSYGRTWYFNDVEVGNSSGSGAIYLKNGVYTLSTKEDDDQRDWFTGAMVKYVANVVVNGSAVQAVANKVNIESGKKYGAVNTTYYVDMEKSVSLEDAGSYYAYKFIPKETGMYKFSVNDEEDDDVKFYDMSGIAIKGTVVNENTLYELKANQTYIVGAGYQTDSRFSITKVIVRDTDTDTPDTEE